MNLTVIWLYLGQIFSPSLGFSFLIYKIKIVRIWPTHLTEIVRIILKETNIYWGFIMYVRLNYKCLIPSNSFNPHQYPRMYVWDYWSTERSDNLVKVTGLSAPRQCGSQAWILNPHALWMGSNQRKYCFESCKALRHPLCFFAQKQTVPFILCTVSGQ